MSTWRKTSKFVTKPHADRRLWLLCATKQYDTLRNKKWHVKATGAHGNSEQVDLVYRPRDKFSGNFYRPLVVSVSKSGEDIFSNYWPISILPCFSKILGKLMYKRIIDFINRNDILNKHQYGFRKKQSTEQAIVELTRVISQQEYFLIFLRHLTQ